ncbi:unnamed protein product [Musa banksii]
MRPVPLHVVHRGCLPDVGRWTTADLTIMAPAMMPSPAASCDARSSGPAMGEASSRLAPKSLHLGTDWVWGRSYLRGREGSGVTRVAGVPCPLVGRRGRAGFGWWWIGESCGASL